MPELLSAPLCLPFPGRTGAGVRIAVIDSGVHPAHDHIAAAQLVEGALIHRDGTVERGVETTLDRLGHGTAVMAAIQEKAPGAVCIPVRVFQDSLKASAAALIAAIRWSAEQRADIINLSLGSPNPAHEQPFARVAEEAAAVGCILIAAREAHGSACYPGALPGVIGVEPDWECDRDRYRARSGPDGELIFLASGHPRPIPGVPQRRNLYGISFATAQMAGFAALACEDMRLTGASARGYPGLRGRLSDEIGLHLPA
ncbi:conserved hypothetical protein [Altererythrobacter sp. B11]|uniref:subtilisin-like serine protease QhpE n=1 Tax=Altererythrobacter sp. B11 TaxID=2060312 RepID=UPI000DC7263E|nr:S8 family serine peptidase [Altererythrobacter sp. B11]BBC73929.1 conserved hypothetical protein [Altererythrobacter sp. B11]